MKFYEIEDRRGWAKGIKREDIFGTKKLWRKYIEDIKKEGRMVTMCGKTKAIAW